MARFFLDTMYLVKQIRASLKIMARGTMLEKKYTGTVKQLKG